jgi:hypothetical protein
LIIVDSTEGEPENLPYTELSTGSCVEVSEKEIATITEESFAIGNVAKGDFILVKIARMRSISHNTPKVMNVFHGYKYDNKY